MKKIAMLVGLAAALGFSNAQAVDWNWKGDVRYRYQSDLVNFDGVDDENSRDRHRMRVRLGVYPWINEELTAGVQISTAGNETTSRNETLDDGFLADNIYLNEAFIDYHPMWLEGNVNFLLGKRSVASTLVTVNDLVWDSDLTFEGATLQYGKDASGKEKEGFGAIAGYYIIDELHPKEANPPVPVINDTKDPYLFAGQLSYKGNVSDLGFQLGVGYYDFVNCDASLDLGWKTNPDYTDKDFNIVEIFGNVGGQITETLPWQIYAQYAFNTASETDWANIDNSKRDAYLVGLKIGDAKQPGQWSVSGDYVRIERDAVTVFTDSDRNGGKSTNLEGFKLGAVFHLVQNLTLGVTYFNFQTIDDDTKRTHTFMADAVVKF